MPITKRSNHLQMLLIKEVSLCLLLAAALNESGRPELALYVDSETLSYAKSPTGNH